MRARVTHAAAVGRRVVLTLAVPMDRTATPDDLARVLRDLGGRRPAVDVTAVAPVVEAAPVAPRGTCTRCKRADIDVVDGVLVSHSPILNKLSRCRGAGDPPAAQEAT